MSIIGQTYANLVDLYRSQGRDGGNQKVIEILAQNNIILQDAISVECNEGTSHLTTVRSGLPEPTWRKLYQGVQPTKGRTAQVRDVTGMLQDYCEVDVDLLNIQKDKQAFMLSQSMAHLHGMNNSMAEALFYGNNNIEGEKFMGLAPRYSDTSAANGNQIIDGGGSGATNTSIWFVTWGDDSTHLIHPEGSMVGVQRKDLGESTKENADGSLYEVYRNQFKWHTGLSVRDWRCNSRVANIDVTALTKDASSGADIIDLMIDAYYQLDNAGMKAGKTVAYCNRTIHKMLHKQAMNAKNQNLSLDTYAGKQQLTFLDGTPIHRCDAILETEDAVS